MQFQLPALSLPPIPHVSLGFLSHTPILFLILCGFFILYSIISGVLMYHWNAYGMNGRGILLGETVFLLVSIILFGAAALAVYYF